MSTQSVRAINRGSDEFSQMYDGVTYTIPAGSELIIPWDAAILWLGDPRLWNSETDRARTKEYDRLQVRWGAIEGIDLADRLPNIAIHLLSDGSEVQMLGVDHKAAPIDVFGSGAEEDMGQEQRLGHLEAQLAAAIARLNELTGGGTPESVSSVPADSSVPAGSSVPSVGDNNNPSITTSDDLPTDGESNPPVPVGAPQATAPQAPASPPPTSTGPNPAEPIRQSAAEALKAEIAARHAAEGSTPG